MKRPTTTAFFILQSGMLDGRIQSDWRQHDVPVTDYKSIDEPVRSITVKSAFLDYRLALYEVRTALEFWPDHEFAIYNAPLKFRSEDAESILVCTANAQNIERLIAITKESK